MIGRGKFANAADVLLQEYRASAVVLVVVRGKTGSGCEVVGDIEEMGKLGETLRNLADDIEEQYRKLPLTKVE